MRVIQHRRTDFALRRHDSHLETTDIVRPKGKPGTGQAETSSKRLGHGLVGRLAIAPPVDGETLAPGGSRSGKDGSTVFAEAVLEGGEDEVVEDLSIVAGSQTRVSNRLDPISRSGLVSLVHFTARQVKRISPCSPPVLVINLCSPRITTIEIRHPSLVRDPFPKVGLPPADLISIGNPLLLATGNDSP